MNEPNLDSLERELRDQRPGTGPRPTRSPQLARLVEEVKSDEESKMAQGAIAWIHNTIDATANELDLLANEAAARAERLRRLRAEVEKGLRMLIAEGEALHEWAVSTRVACKGVGTNLRGEG